MKTKLLVDRLLKPDHFLRSSSEAGPYIGQPVPNANNEGQLRLVSSGDENDQIANFQYTGGQASANGTQTSLIDERLRAFGSGMLVGATVTLTSGSSAGESRTVTNFTSDLGTLEWAGDVSATLSGDSYSLTIDYRNRSFIVNLKTGGDTGEADFLWSPNGGTTYFGRETPATTDWQAGTTVCTDFFGYKFEQGGPTWPLSNVQGIPIIQAANGDLVVPYCRAASSNLLVDISSNNGISWSTVDTGFTNVYRYMSDSILLKSGRILVVGGALGIEAVVSAEGYSVIMYSDDYGQTWKKKKIYGATYVPGIERIIELNNGNLLAIDRDYEVDAVVRVSTDKGSYWGNGITAHSGASEINAFDIVQMADDNILLVYYTKELDPGTTYAIRSVLSTDNGSTWSGVTTIASGNNHLLMPCLEKDVNGDIFCAFTEQVTGAGSSIVFMVSTDNGSSWGTSRILAKNENHSLMYPYLNLINGHEMVCSYVDSNAGATNAVYCRIGRSSQSPIVGVSNIVCAPDLVKHRLINDVAIQWFGGDGIVDDSWTFTPEHHYAAKNIIADTPNKVWRSTVDGVTCEFVIDMGANNVFYMDAIALFDCNINTCSIELNATDTWTSPFSSTSIDFTCYAGAVNSINNQYLSDLSLVTNYADHELYNEDYYVIMTSGTSNGTAFKVADNIFGQYLVLDTTQAHAVAWPDTFNFYGSRKYKEINQLAPVGRRYIRVYIPAQKTPQGYYQIGTAILGKYTEPDNTFADSGYARNNDYNISLAKSMAGQLVPTVRTRKRRNWSLTWQNSENSRKQVEAVADYSRGKNIALVPDWFYLESSGVSKSATTDVYLVKQSGSVRETFKYKNRWDLSIDFEENI